MPLRSLERVKKSAWKCWKKWESPISRVKWKESPIRLMRNLKS